MEKTWDGIERRGELKQLGFCPAHIEQVADMAVIKNSLLNIEKTISESTSFKTGMVLSVIGITFTLVVQIIIFSYLYGGLVKQVEINTTKWANLGIDTRLKADDIKASLKDQLEQLRIEIRNPAVYKVK